MFQVVRPLSPDAWLPDRDPFRAGGHGLCLVAHGSSVGWARAIAILLSVAVTVFASLQTFLRYSERAEKHKAAATEFGKLRRELEQLIAFIPAGGTVAAGDMKSIRTQWGELSAHAPSIPNQVYTRMFLKVWHKPGLAGQPHVPPPPTAP